LHDANVDWNSPKLQAQVHNFLNTFEVPQPYKCAVKRLKLKTTENAQNSDVENRAYVEL